MVIGQRLRELRESKKLSQGDIERRTGLLRCYTSRVENGHTVPNVETLEKYARALEVPLYKLFYDGDELPKRPELTFAGSGNVAFSKSDQHELLKFSKLLARLNDGQRILLLSLAQRMAI